MVNWLKRWRGPASSDERRRSLLRAARVFLALFLAASLAGGGRIAWALHTGQTWFNYRGDALRRPELVHGLMLFGVTALLSALGLLLMRKPAHEPD